jgi:mRNA-degrading endonuclease toxin of MazEF toxin-antitoxin module
MAHGPAGRQRPALIVSSALFHIEHQDRIILPISSQVRPGRETEVAIGNWKRAELLGPSVVKPAPATLENGLISRKLGHLADPDLAAVRELLRKILVLDG